MYHTYSPFFVGSFSTFKISSSPDTKNANVRVRVSVPRITHLPSFVIWVRFCCAHDVSESHGCIPTEILSVGVFVLFRFNEITRTHTSTHQRPDEDNLIYKQRHLALEIRVPVICMLEVKFEVVVYP